MGEPAREFATREQAKARLADIEVKLATPGLQKYVRSPLILEKLIIQKHLASGRLPSEAQAAGAAKRENLRQGLRSDGRPRPIPAPPLFVDDYVGPRCDYCAGPKPNGICLNAGPDWPHPPTRPTPEERSEPHGITKETR